MRPTSVYSIEPIGGALPTLPVQPSEIVQTITLCDINNVSFYHWLSSEWTWPKHPCVVVHYPREPANELCDKAATPFFFPSSVLFLISMRLLRYKLFNWIWYLWIYFTWNCYQIINVYCISFQIFLGLIIFPEDDLFRNWLCLNVINTLDLYISVFILRITFSRKQPNSDTSFIILAGLGDELHRFEITGIFILIFQ